MRCKNCRYQLWNLTSRQCPECGQPFKPSEFRFGRNLVQFCCPHCQQAYYGTDDAGLPQPRTFTCAGCQQTIDLDEMVLVPAQGVDPDRAEQIANPWIERRGQGMIRRWFGTVGRGMSSPMRLIRDTPLESGANAALWYATFTIMVTTVLGCSPFLVLSLIFAVTSGGKGAFGAVGFGVFFLAIAAGYLAFLLIWILLTHGLLRLTGPTAHGMGRTAQAICYAAGPLALAAVPCVGPNLLAWVASVWWMVSATLMVCAGQGVRGWRGALATLAMPALIILMVVGSIVWVVVSVQNTMSHAMNFPTPGVGAQSVHMNLVVELIQGRTPRHGAELMLGSSTQPSHFLKPGSASVLSRVPIGGVTLDRWYRLTPAQQQAEVRAAAAALPPNTIAHRLGDIVFTYHGMSGTGVDPDLWIMIVCPDPDQDASGAQGEIEVDMPNGSSRTISVADRAAALQAQNALRASHGLAPLPDPATVTHASPATAPPPAATTTGPADSPVEMDEPLLVR